MDLKKNGVIKKLEHQGINRESLFSTCALVDNKFFAFTNFKRLPMMGDLYTGEITLLKALKGYDPLFVADNMISIGTDIFVLELNGNRIFKYDTNNRICQYFDIHCHQQNWDNYAAFAWFGKYLYIVPRYKNEMLKFEIESGKIQKKEILYQEKNADRKNINFEKDCECFSYGCQSKNVLWLFQKESNLITEYNMEKDFCRKHKLPLAIQDCVHAIPHNEKLIILSSEGNIYQWDIEKESMEVLIDCSEKEEKPNIFARIAVTDKNIFLLPSLGEDIFCVNMETKEARKYLAYPEGFNYCAPNVWSKYHGYCENDDFYFFAMRSANFMLAINKKNGKEKWIKPILPKHEDYIEKYIKYNESMMDEVSCDLKSMLVNLKKDIINKRYKHHALVGNEIWNEIK